MANPTPEQIDISKKFHMSVDNFSVDLEKVILGLAKRFDRMPTDNEVYRFVWGTPMDRQRIYQHKGLPEDQR